jgi:hypothetical protein
VKPTFGRCGTQACLCLRLIRRGTLSSQPQAHEPAHSLSTVRLILLRTPPLIDRLKIRPVPAAVDQNVVACGGRAANKATELGVSGVRIPLDSCDPDGFGLPLVLPYAGLLTARLPDPCRTWEKSRGGGQFRLPNQYGGCRRTRTFDPLIKSQRQRGTHEAAEARTSKLKPWCCHAFPQSTLCQ